MSRRNPTDPAEDYALKQLHELAEPPDWYIDPEEMLQFGSKVDKFDKRLDEYVAQKGWYREPPDKSIERWSFRGGIVLVLGIVAAIVAYNLPSGGLMLLGVALVIAGITMMILARVMPQRTMAGAMTYAMLAAYRRTLQKTMESARSMNDVVASKTIPWLETPDQAVVWGVALGLHDEVESVLQRSFQDVQAGTVSTPYFPIWYGGFSGGSMGGGGAGGGGGLAPGLFSERRPAGFRRDDVGARDDRQLAGVIGQRRGRRRVLGRGKRWGRGRRRRRLLSAAASERVASLKIPRVRRRPCGPQPFRLGSWVPSRPWKTSSRDSTRATAPAP